MAIKNIFNRFIKQKPASLPITIVSGLPRSGTSLMMQMLAAGGMKILTDQERTADQDNPKGYYELEGVKKLKQGDVAWVSQAPGKVVKVISALLEKLPPEYEYRVLFMQREIEEVLASQKQMLIRRGEPTDKVSDEELGRLFEQHLGKVRGWVAGQKNFSVLYVPYAELVGNPQAFSQKIATFLGEPLDVEAMSAIPDPKLYRQKTA